MQVNKSVEEVRNASAYVKEVDDAVVEVEVQAVRHLILPFLFSLTIY